MPLDPKEFEKELERLPNEDKFDDKFKWLDEIKHLFASMSHGYLKAKEKRRRRPPIVTGASLEPPEDYLASYFEDLHERVVDEFLRRHPDLEYEDIEDLIDDNWIDIEKIVDNT